MSHKKCGWHEKIEGYYQNDFSVSKILGQLSDYNDALNMQIQTMRTTRDDRLVSSAKMRATEKLCQPENSNATMNTPGNTSE